MSGCVTNASGVGIFRQLSDCFEIVKAGHSLKDRVYYRGVDTRSCHHSVLWCVCVTLGPAIIVSCGGVCVTLGPAIIVSCVTLGPAIIVSCGVCVTLSPAIIVSCGACVTLGPAIIVSCGVCVLH